MWGNVEDGGNIKVFMTIASTILEAARGCIGCFRLGEFLVTGTRYGTAVCMMEGGPRASEIVEKEFKTRNEDRGDLY
jgi:AMMECR1 domain-containing protein